MYYQLVLRVKDSGLKAVNIWYDNLKEATEAFSELSYGVNKSEFELCVLDEKQNVVCTSKEA